MLQLFSTTIFYNQGNQEFSIYKLADNLYQARSDFHVVVLWKNNNEWEGAGNTEETSLIGMIGSAIDKHLNVNSITKN